ncbi:MAG: hypothetical protein PHU50_05280, partial [Kiritimatiellae bacterium]|nr:hypothetical protein [Kiritimatiellia bacterium]
MKNEEWRQFSTAWKLFFHGVENPEEKFPWRGKSGEHFSMAWKTVNHRTDPFGDPGRKSEYLRSDPARSSAALPGAEEADEL